MKVTIAFVLACMAAVSTGFPMVQVKSVDDQAWNAYKRQYGKTYTSAAEEKFRKDIWMRNAEKNFILNFEAARGVHHYIVGFNKFSDMTLEEFRRTHLGLRIRKNARRGGAAFLPPQNVKIPESIDWRQHGYVTPVKNQRRCGSCWAFSATGSLEGQHFRKTGNLVSLSEQNLVDCSRKFGNDGCDGGLMDDAFRYIMANKGLDTEASYPYEATDNECRFERKNVGATVSNFVDIPSGDEEKLKLAVATVGPISVAINAGSYGFQSYHGGVYDPADCDPKQLDHGVLVVGYGNLNGSDYWMVKNSWDTDWGLNGYIMMARNKNNKCGIATLASYPLV